MRGRSSREMQKNQPGQKGVKLGSKFRVSSPAWLSNDCRAGNTRTAVWSMCERS